MPFKGGKTKAGYAVVRRDPWSFIGLYKTKEKAARVAAEFGTDYEVHWGEHEEGTDNFVWTSDNKPTA